MTNPAVEVRGLSKLYGGRAVVDDLSFTVQAGEVFALLGPNGAGKTTTVEILEGYRKQDGGAVRVLGLDPRREGRHLKPRIGLMLQQGGLFPQITPREALTLWPEAASEPWTGAGRPTRPGISGRADRGDGPARPP